VHQCLAPLVNDCIEIPRELYTSQYTDDLCIDNMFVDSLVFFTAVSKEIKFSKFLTVRTLRNKILIFKRMINFQKVKRNHFKLKHKT